MPETPNATSTAEPSAENAQPMPVVENGTPRVAASGSATNASIPQSLRMRSRMA